jgi:hypothetical protein
MAEAAWDDWLMPVLALARLDSEEPLAFETHVEAYVVVMFGVAQR